ncbi:RNA polymerase sigma factor [Streptomyces sp. NPDC056374]|uniref:RNA polymerase sigma factor n=1 Tax=unclassified Streptomyces TaxID=2593676 RepID=UPI0035D725B1
MTPSGITNWEAVLGEDTESASRARFLVFYADLLPRLTRHLQGRFPLLGHAEAEDVAADVLFKAYTDWDRLETLQNPTAYVFRSAQRRAIDAYRNRQRARLAEEDVAAALIREAAQSHHDHPSDSTDGETADMVREAIQAMRPTKRREVVHLQSDGWSDTDIATALGISRNQLHVQRHHAVNELRKALAQHIRKKPARVAPTTEDQHTEVDAPRPEQSSGAQGVSESALGKPR